MYKVRFLIFIVLAAGLLSACSLKKNTAASRQYTAFITRYNIYYNGDEHYKQTLADMESKYADDYTRTVLMHPAEAFADEKAPQPSGDFKRSIEKAQKAIQLRSIKKRPARKAGKANDPEYKAWLKREEYNPFLHNAWMMMGRSQYMGGDFLGASATFFYISKHFSWLPATVTEAKLWQARSYLAVDWLFEAESILQRIKEKDLTTPALKDLYDFVQADFYVRSNMYAEALPYLKRATAAAKGSQRTRLTFLTAQLYQSLGQPDEAYNYYKKVGNSSAADYRTRLNARVKRSEVYQGSNITPEVKALKSMAKQSRNKEYLDQIYYAIANLYLSRGDTTQAIANYKLAVEKSTRAGIDKAIAQITLGRLYFGRGNYDLAQPCYAEAIGTLPPTYPNLSTLRRESDVLDELAIYSQAVTLQDSLLRLSAMPREKQLEVVDRIIKDLKDKEKKEAEDRRREEYLSQQRASGTGLNTSGVAAPTTFVMNTDNSWYFYNEATRNAGRTEFQKRWGTRRLEDDWRRRNKASFGLSDMDNSADSPSDTIALDTPQQENLSEEVIKKQSDPHYPEYYLKQIPVTDAERQQANDVIMEGLYNMGVILKDKLGDMAASEREFNELLSRYPNNPYRLEVYNNLFLMYLRTGNEANTQLMRQKILAEYPDSKIAEALRPANYRDRFVASDSMQQVLYNEAYEAYMANKNALVHRICAVAREDYPMSRIMPKFMFINALAYVTEGEPEKFGSALRELMERYPDSDVSPLAGEWLANLQSGRKLNSSATSNVRGMVWSTRLLADSAKAADANAPAQFELNNPDTPQLLVFLYPTASVNANALLFDVARFNFNNFTVRDFDLEQLTFSGLGLTIVKGFHSVADINRYRTMMENAATGLKLPKQVVPVVISEQNFNTLLSQGRSFDEYFEAIGDKRLEQLGAMAEEEETPESTATKAPAPAPQSLSQPIVKELEPDNESTTPSAADEQPYDIPVPKLPAPPVPAHNTLTPDTIVTTQAPPSHVEEQKTVPSPKPQPTPVPKPSPKPTPQPTPVPPRPEIPSGSEGDDDPLLFY